MGQCILSAFADEYDDLTAEQLQGLASFGISYIEVRHLNGINVSRLSKEKIKETKTLMEAYGIRASAIGSPLGKVSLEGDLTDHLETARHVFEAANLLEAGYVRIFSFYAPEGKDITQMRGEVFDGLERLLLLARRFGVTLCHENEAGIYGSIPLRCREISDYFQGEIRCVFDMGNYVLEGVDPYPEAYGLLREHIAYFHIKDALGAGAVVPPGKGEAKIREILAAHRAYTREDFFVSLEPHLQTFSGRNALVGRSFRNPYRYPDARSAFADAVNKYKELIR